MKKENSVGAGPEGAGLGSRTNFQVRWKLQKKNYAKMTLRIALGSEYAIFSPIFW